MDITMGGLKSATLKIGGDTVAVSETFNTAKNAASATFFYRGAILMDSQVTLEVLSTEDADIEQSWGYKLYKPDYNLISSVDTSCISVWILKCQIDSKDDYSKV